MHRAGKRLSAVAQSFKGFVLTEAVHILNLPRLPSRTDA
jgi:hypothetical protein